MLRGREPERAIAEWFRERRSEAFAAAGASLLAAAPLVQGDLGQIGKTLLMALLGGLFVAVGIHTAGTRRRQLRQLEENLTLAQRNALEAETSEKQAWAAANESLSLLLVSLSQRLELTSHERVTLYAHDGRRGFFRLGRYSENAIFMRLGRDYYPEDEGFLGRAWAEGTCYEAMLPDPVADRGRYDDRHRRAGLSDDAIADLGMRSRSYFGVAIYNPPHTERIGVVMFESTTPRGLTRVREDFPGSPDAMSLGGHILLLRPRESADVDEARRRGF